jgi:hypothetical protein
MKYLFQQRAILTEGKESEKSESEIRIKETVLRFVGSFKCVPVVPQRERFRLRNKIHRTDTLSVQHSAGYP